MFLDVPPAIETEEADGITIEHLLLDDDHPCDMLYRRRVLDFDRVTIHGYLLAVAVGTLPVEHQIIYHLQGCAQCLPGSGWPCVDTSFTSSMNDQLLVVDLSVLLQTLHASAENKATTWRTEPDKQK